MSDSGLFLQTHIGEIVVFVLCLVGCVVIYFNIKKKPESWGIKRPLTLRSYSPVLFPLAVFSIFLFFRVMQSEGFSYPSGIGVHGDVVLLGGVSEEDNEDANGMTETSYYSLMMLLNKQDGKKIAMLNFDPWYVAQDKVLGNGGIQYQIVDLKTGKITESLDEDDIKGQAGAISGEKIYSLGFKDNTFLVQTVKDKHFTYDPISRKPNSTETAGPFNAMRHEDFNSKQHDFFQPKIIAKSPGGITLLMSYTDLEKDHFFIHALDNTGKLLWTKQDTQISPDLKGERFTASELEANTVADDTHLYFVNLRHAVCMSLENGTLKWIVEI